MFEPQIAASQGPGSRFITWDAAPATATRRTHLTRSAIGTRADDLKGLLRPSPNRAGRDRRDELRKAASSPFVCRLKYPERVSALVLIGTQAGIEDPEKVAIYQVMLDVWEAEGLNATSWREPSPRSSLATAGGGSDQWIAKWHQKSRSLLRQAFQTLVSRDDIHHRLGEITAPALVIHGTADAAIDLEKAQRLCSELANCRQMVAIEGGGHASNLTHPKLVNLALQQFLVGLELPSPRRVDIERRIAERRRESGMDAAQIAAPVNRRLAERRAR